MKASAPFLMIAISLCLPACEGSPSCKEVAQHAVVVVRDTARNAIGAKSYDDLKQVSAAVTKGVAIPGGDLMGLQESMLYATYFNSCNSGNMSAEKRRCLVAAKNQGELMNCMLSDVPGFGPNDLPK